MGKTPSESRKFSRFLTNHLRMEWLNKTISAILKKITTDRLKIINEWPKALAAIQFSINQRFSKATEFQPFQLMFGRNSLVMKEFDESELNEEFIIEKWMEVFERLFPMSEEHMKRYQTKMKKDVDQSHRMAVSTEKGSEYSVGDLVF